MSREQGKPLAEGARSRVVRAGFAEEATRTYGDIIPQQQRGKRLSAVKEPIGVVAAITPWNFPLAMIARKIAPALAAGCTIVAKPGGHAAHRARARVPRAGSGRAGGRAEPDHGVARGIDAAADWLADSRVRKITFTGSTAVGKLLARDSAATLKKLSLELGGNAPFIVFDDAEPMPRSTG